MTASYIKHLLVLEKELHLTNPSFEEISIDTFIINKLQFTTEDFKALFTLVQTNIDFSERYIEEVNFISKISLNILNSNLFTEELIIFILQKQKGDYIASLPFNKISKKINQVVLYNLTNTKIKFKKYFLNYLTLTYEDFNNLLTHLIDNLRYAEDGGQDIKKIANFVSNLREETFNLNNYANSEEQTKNSLKLFSFQMKALKENQNPYLVKLFLSPCFANNRDYNDSFYSKEESKIIKYIIDNKFYELLKLEEDLLYFDKEFQTQELLNHFRPLKRRDSIISYINVELLLEDEIDTLFNQDKRFYRNSYVKEFFVELFSLSPDESPLSKKFFLKNKDSIPVRYFFSNINLEFKLKDEFYFELLSDYVQGKYKKLQLENSSLNTWYSIKRFKKLIKFNKQKEKTYIYFYNLTKNSELWKIMDKEVKDFLYQEINNINYFEYSLLFGLKRNKDMKEWGVKDIVSLYNVKLQTLNNNKETYLNLEENGKLNFNKFNPVLYVLADIYNYSTKIMFSNIISFNSLDIINKKQVEIAEALKLGYFLEDFELLKQLSQNEILRNIIVENCSDTKTLYYVLKKYKEV